MAEYSPADLAFLAAIERNCGEFQHIAMGVSRDCYECGIPEDTTDDELECWEEGSFTWRGCDSCRLHLGMTVYPAHGMIPPEKPGADWGCVHLDICGDCLCYHANGELPPEDWQGWEPEEPEEPEEPGDDI